MDPPATKKPVPSPPPPPFVPHCLHQMPYPSATPPTGHPGYTPVPQTPQRPEEYVSEIFWWRGDLLTWYPTAIPTLQYHDGGANDDAADAGNARIPTRWDVSWRRQ